MGLDSIRFHRILKRAVGTFFLNSRMFPRIVLQSFIKSIFLVRSFLANDPVFYNSSNKGLKKVRMCEV
ncbi:hypothetical protein LEP1GSC071_0318 [Leptospira santarosai str. JET]|nr:hypothetical protein LEP1GSC071_0318 [Leptospira santarosai str. JET]